MVSNEIIMKKLGSIQFSRTDPLSNEIEKSKNKLEKINLEKVILEENKIYLTLISLMIVSCILIFACTIKLSL
tara:strand:- start:873 stop:1091 length:219 start_codon:yes stop_codon:yes gene_type:complete